jgi:UBX domain-containing protein 1
MSDSVAAFIEITQADAANAHHYLEMANNNIDRAIELFFENGPMRLGGREPAPKPTPPVVKPAPGPGGASRPGVAPRPAPAPPKDNFGTMVDDILHHAEHQGPVSPELLDPEKGKLEKLKVTFWKNGFQIADGDFRSSDDPKNTEFIESISRGVIPRELMKPGLEIDLEIDDKREQDYKAKPKPKDPWSGPSRSVNGQSAAPVKPPAAQVAPAAPVKTNYQTQGAPGTRIRFQLQDGQVLQLSVNLSATVGDLRRYLTENRPELRGRALKLEVGLPVKVLTDNSATVEAEGLKMAQIRVSYQ